MDTSYIPATFKQTLCEDFARKKELLATHPKVFFRPGDRTHPSHPTYWQVDEEGLSTIGFITQYGSHAARELPILDDTNLLVKIIKRTAKPTQEISSNELQNAYNNLDSVDAVIKYIQDKYPATEVTLDTIVTVYTIQYVT